jgi:glycosyltransferase involved in cell wall biosynthesis
LVYNGIPIDRFFIGEQKKEPIAITVGGIKSSNLKRKGIETFVKAANYLPEVKFVVIGKIIDNSINYLKSIASDNVEFTDFVTDNELLKWYQKAKVYVQPSAHEGFGVTVAESMLCECIPVVTKKFALPEIVGKTGFYIPFGDPKATAQIILQALKVSSENGQKARERIQKNFSLKKRKEKLISIINNI